MNYSSILYEINEKGVALITLNRPEVANAANITLCEECADAFQNATEDKKVTVVIITGAGKAFSAGGDISMILNAVEVDAKKSITVSVNKAVKAAYACPKPIIAAVNGVVGGGGICFVQVCDLVFASEKAQFSSNFLKIAACPDGGTTYFMPRQLGYRKAFELLLGTEAISAREAMDIGLVNRVLPHESLMEHSMNVAETLSRGPSQAQTYTKWLLREGLKNDLLTQLELESFAQLVAWSSKDFVEGTQAFFEKRLPRFS